MNMQKIKFFEYIRSLITIYEYKSYIEVEYDQKEELTAYYIAQDLHAHSEFLPESKDYQDVIGTLTQLMINPTSDKTELLTDKMKSIAVDYYEDTIAKIFDAEVSSIQAEINYDRGLSKSYHKDNGEAYWSR